MNMREINLKLKMTKILKELPRATCLFSEIIVLSFRLAFSVITSGLRCIVPPLKKNLLGETVLITGAGHGIGRELAVQLARLGCRVVCWDRDKERNLATRSAVLEEGGEVYDFVVDVSSRMEVREAFRLMRKYRVPDVTMLINNAGILRHKPFLDHDPDDIEETFKVNVLSQFWTIETVLPQMLQNKRGHIVSVCSLCGVYGVSQKVPYCSSKFAVRGLMDGLRDEFKSQKFINFTTIYPFYVDTGLAQDPKYRLSWIFRSVTPEYAAEEIIKAVQRNYYEFILPRWLHPLNYLLSILPHSSVNLILNYLSRYEYQK